MHGSVPLKSSLPRGTVCRTGGTRAWIFPFYLPVSRTVSFRLASSQGLSNYHFKLSQNKMEVNTFKRSRWLCWRVLNQAASHPAGGKGLEQVDKVRDSLGAGEATRKLLWEEIGW